ncbi:NADP-dependent oxidoreductase [Chryseobacterium sp. Ch-15]|uniref:NADP-dependent oxidoreductase n=1 Tax=Chryseobacterium muglaense TaxID=2893752 RepID=A0A9Q3UY51_9FLAO|nr:NADP-dependent oxidoreductase [Chryseobacterium muglaense]MBD3903278.1 NADP-dependent oxidoreductase [Chryseobacterium muglaense]MCC9036108.1 NADP-dependent oxidoreductase [Chryseobacterium muglaense]MCM2553316.1 NADP-dependent oxidoreductase [Chryseobacterium muglaense]
MKTIILNEAGSVDNLQYIGSAKPTISSNEVLVKTVSLGINVIDYKVRANDGALNWILGADRPAIIGWDLSGTVVEVGDDVTDFKIGDDVFGMANFPGKGNAYSEFVAVPSAHLTLKPANISHQEAAAATLAALTAWQGLVEKGNVKKGDKVLIHAASGGVGHYATQIAKHLGAYVIGTSSAKNREFVLQNGADQHIDYTTENFQEIVSDVDFVLDTVGGDTILKSLEVIKQGGTIVSIASSNLSTEELEKAKSKEVNLSFLLVQSSGENMLQLAQLMEKGIIKSHVSKTFSFDQMGEAHLHLEKGRTVGKIVVNL